MIQISDHSVENFVELTSDMLEYNGKMKLEKYLIFDPTIRFNYALKQKILSLSYDKKVEIFFNAQTFDRKIVNSIELKQDEEKAKTSLTISDIVLKEKNQVNASFEFIIQCIFCTGLPLSNYYKTMEFYDLNATKSKMVASRSTTLYDFINPTPIKKCFSYIKLNGKKYTVTGLTWINDVLNHPVYMDIIKKYKKYDIERKKVDPTKSKHDLNIKLDSLILDIYDLPVFDVPNIEVSLNDSSRYKDLLVSRKRLQALFKDIKNMKDCPSFFKTTYQQDEVKQFIDGFTEVKNEFEREKEDIDHRARSLLLKFNANIQNQTLKAKIMDLDNHIEMNKFKSEIKIIFLGYSYDEFYSIFKNTSYDVDLMKYYKPLKMLFMKNDMYKIILNDGTYQDKTPAYIKEMDALIEKEVKNYYDYKQAFKKIEEDRIISNDHWKKEADIINGEVSVLQNKDLIKSDSLFDIILKCDKQNKACVKDREAIPYLEIGLEQINRTDKTSITYEAYINLEVAEGVYDESNNHLLMCTYISNVLGDSYDEMIKKEGKNNVMRNRVFVGSIREANKLPLKQNNNSNNKSKNKQPNAATKKRRSRRRNTKGRKTRTKG